MRRHDVLLADRLGLHADRAFQLDALQAHALGITLFLRIEQALIVFARELGIDWQPDRRVVVATARQAHGDVDHLVAVRTHLHPARVLFLGEGLLEDVLQLHFPPAAAVLDVGQYPLQVAHAGRQLLHFTQPALHLFQAFGHQLERIAQPRFQRGLQLLVHGVAHLLELLRVVGLQRAQLFFQGGAHFRDALFVALGQLLQAQAQALGQALLRLRAFFAALAGILNQGLPQRTELGIGTGCQFLQLLSERMDARLLLLAEHIQLHTQFLQAFAQRDGTALLTVGRLGAGLARIFAQRFTQQIQTLIGAGGQIGQRAREPIELLAQLAAADARFITHGLFQAVVGRAAQQRHQLQDEHDQQQAGDEEEFGLHVASVGWPSLSC
ncbi:hypothetical protein D3C81_792580 [compost metagenome]